MPLAPGYLLRKPKNTPAPKEEKQEWIPQLPREMANLAFLAEKMPLIPPIPKEVVNRLDFNEAFQISQTEGPLGINEKFTEADFAKEESPELKKDVENFLRRLESPEVDEDAKQLKSLYEKWSDKRYGSGSNWSSLFNYLRVFDDVSDFPKDWQRGKKERLVKIVKKVLKGKELTSRESSIFRKGINEARQSIDSNIENSNRLSKRFPNLAGKPLKSSQEVLQLIESGINIRSGVDKLKRGEIYDGAVTLGQGVIGPFTALDSGSDVAKNIWKKTKSSFGPGIRQAAKKGGRFIPVIGSFASAGMGAMAALKNGKEAYDAFQKGEVGTGIAFAGVTALNAITAGLDVVSGILDFVPGVGTLASVIIDGVSLVLDFAATILGWLASDGIFGRRKSAAELRREEFEKHIKSKAFRTATAQISQYFEQLGYEKFIHIFTDPKSKEDNPTVYPNEERFEQKEGSSRGQAVLLDIHRIRLGRYRYEGGGPKDDIIFGNTPVEYNLAGNAGDDILQGNTKADTLVGGAGNDYLIGKEGDDYLYGDGGDDILKGGKGSDQLWGGAGNDILMGGTGNDKLQGGAGQDRYIIVPDNKDDHVEISDQSRGNILEFQGMEWGDVKPHIPDAREKGIYFTLKGGKRVVDYHSSTHWDLPQIRSLQQEHGGSIPFYLRDQLEDFILRFPSIIIGSRVLGATDILAWFIQEHAELAELGPTIIAGEHNEELPVDNRGTGKKEYYQVKKGRLGIYLGDGSTVDFSQWQAPPEGTSSRHIVYLGNNNTVVVTPETPVDMWIHQRRDNLSFLGRRLKMVLKINEDDDLKTFFPNEMSVGERGVPGTNTNTPVSKMDLGQTSIHLYGVGTTSFCQDLRILVIEWQDGNSMEFRFGNQGLPARFDIFREIAKRRGVPSSR